MAEPITNPEQNTTPKFTPRVENNPFTPPAPPTNPYQAEATQNVFSYWKQSKAPSTKPGELSVYVWGRKGDRNPATYTPEVEANIHKPYWSEPGRVVRYKQMLDTTPPDVPIPDWLDKDKVNTLYNYLEFINPNKKAEEWDAINPADPNYSMVEGLTSPPQDLLPYPERDPVTQANDIIDHWKKRYEGQYAELEKLTKEYNAEFAEKFTEDTIKQNEIDFSKLQPFQQFLVATQAITPGKNKPQWMENVEFGSSVVKTGMMASTATGLFTGALGAAGVSSVAGPGGWLVGMGLGLGFGIYATILAKSGDVVGAQKIFALFNKPAEWTEQLMGAKAAQQQLTSLGADTSKMKYRDFFEAGKSFYESNFYELGNIETDLISQAAHLLNPEWSSGMTTDPGEVWQFQKGIVEPQAIREGFLVGNPLAEATMRLANGEASTVVYEDMVDRYGYSGTKADFIMQSWVDPTQFMPFIMSAAGEKIAGWAKQPQLAASFKNVRGNVLADAMPGYLQMPTQMAISLYNRIVLAKTPKGTLPNFINFKVSGGIFDVVNDYRFHLRTGTSPMGILPKLTDDFTGFDRILAGIDKTTGMPAESAGLDSQGYIANKRIANIMGGATPLTKVARLKDNLTGGIENMWERSNHNIDLLPDEINKVIAGKASVVAGEAATYFYDSPEARAVAGALKVAMASSRVKNLMSAWQSLAPQRALLKDLSDGLNITPEAILLRMEKGETSQMIADFKNSGINISNNTMRSILNHTLDEAGIKTLFKDMIRDKIPANPEIMFVKFTDELDRGMSDYLAKNYEVPVKESTMFKAARLNKSIQSLFVLGLNPNFLVKNFVNNIATMAYQRVGGLYSTDMNQLIYDKYGIIKPARAGEGYTMIGIVPKVKPEDKGFIDKAQNLVSEITKKTALASNLSMKVEQACSASVVTTGIDYIMRNEWLSGNSITDLPASVKQQLTTQGINPNNILNIVRATVSVDDLARGPKPKAHVEIKMNLAVDATFKQLGIDPSIGNDFIAKTGLADALTRYMNDDGLTFDQAMSRYKRTLDYHVTQLKAEEMLDTYADTNAVIKNSGYSGGVHIFNQLRQDEITHNNRIQRMEYENMLEARGIRDQAKVATGPERGRLYDDANAHYHIRQNEIAVAMQEHIDDRINVLAPVLNALDVEVPAQARYVSATLAEHRAYVKFMYDKIEANDLWFDPDPKVPKPTWAEVEAKTRAIGVTYKEEQIAIRKELYDATVGLFGDDANVINKVKDWLNSNAAVQDEIDGMTDRFMAYLSKQKGEEARDAAWLTFNKKVEALQAKTMDQDFTMGDIVNEVIRTAPEADGTTAGRPAEPEVPEAEFETPGIRTSGKYVMDPTGNRVWVKSTTKPRQTQVDPDTGNFFNALDQPLYDADEVAIDKAYWVDMPKHPNEITRVGDQTVYQNINAIVRKEIEFDKPGNVHNEKAVDGITVAIWKEVRNALINDEPIDQYLRPMHIRDYEQSFDENFKPVMQADKLAKAGAKSRSSEVPIFSEEFDWDKWGREHKPVYVNPLDESSGKKSAETLMAKTINEANARPSNLDPNGKYTYDEYQIRADVEKRLLNINRIEKKYRDGWLHKNATELQELTAVIEADFHMPHDEARAAVALMCVKAEEYTFRTKQIDPMAYMRRYQYEAVDESVFAQSTPAGMIPGKTGRSFLNPDRSKWVIQATKAANATTWLHEMAHTWITDLDMDDINILGKWSGFTSGKQFLDAEFEFRNTVLKPDEKPSANYIAYSRAQEQIVAAFEQDYYQKAKPLNELQVATASPSIARGFQHLMIKFRDWIVKLYDNMERLPATGQAAEINKNPNSVYGIEVSQEVSIALYHLYNGYRKDQVWKGNPTLDHLPVSMAYFDDLYTKMNGGKHINSKMYANAADLQSVVDLAPPKVSTVTVATQPGMMAVDVITEGGYGRYSKNGYEVSSAGDKRFSALSAKLADGRTIEEHYQVDYKGYKSIAEGKGKPPLNSDTQAQSYAAYKKLWEQYLSENPELLPDLRIKSEGKVLTDKFATTNITQARALYEILNGTITEPIANMDIAPFKSPKPYVKKIAETAHVNYGKNTILDLAAQYYKDLNTDTQSLIAVEIRKNSSTIEGLEPGTSAHNYMKQNGLTQAQLTKAVEAIESGNYKPTNDLQLNLVYQAISNLKETTPEISRFMNLTVVDKFYNSLDQLDEVRLAPLTDLSDAGFDPDEGVVRKYNWMNNIDFIEETHTLYQKTIQDIRNSKELSDDAANKLIYRGRQSLNKLNTVINSFEDYRTGTYIKTIKPDAKYTDPSSDLIGGSNMVLDNSYQRPGTNEGVKDPGISKELGFENIYRKDAESSFTPKEKAGYAALETKVKSIENNEVYGPWMPGQKELEQSRLLDNEPEPGRPTNPVTYQSPEDQEMIRFANEAVINERKGWKEQSWGFEAEFENTYARTNGKGPEWEAILQKARNMRQSVMYELEGYSNKAEGLSYIQDVMFPSMGNIKSDLAEKTFNLKRYIVDPQAEMVENFHAQYPSAMLQPNPGPLLHNPIASVATTLKQGKAWRDQAANVAILLKALRDNYNSNTKSYGYEGLDKLTPDARAEFDTWLKSVGTQLAGTKQKALRYGLAQRDAALLNYGDRNGFDNYFDMLFPYQFWYSRSMAEWTKRSINRPSILALAGRRQAMAERLGKELGEYPTRLQGKYKIPWAFAEKWMGEDVYINPWMDLMPVNQLMQPFEQLNRNATSLRPDIALSEMVRNNEITQAQMDTAMTNMSDENWVKAMDTAQKENPAEDDPYSLISMMMTPNWLISEVEGWVTGKPKANMPRTNLGLTVQSHADTIGKAIGKSDPKIGDAIKEILTWTGKKMEWSEKAIRGSNFSYFGEWGPWLVQRELSNMAAEGMDVTAVRRAMIEKKGDLWAEASKRVRDQVSLKTPGSLFARMVEEGEYSNMPWAIVATLFPAGIFPEGEMAQLGLKADMQKAWDVAAQTGDKSVMDDWFKAHPEYMARAALNDDPDTMLKKFLVNQIMDGYTSEANINKSLIKAHLGDDFLNKLLDPDNASGKVDYKALDLQKLVDWARTLKKEIPITEETMNLKIQGDKIATYTPEEISELTTYFDTREQLYPTHQQLNEQYGNLKTDQEKKIFVAKYPEIKKYWDWSKEYRETHATVKAWAAKYADPNEVAHDPYYGLDPAKIQGYYEYKQTNFPNVGWLNTEYFQIPEKSYAAKKNFLAKYPELKAYWDWKDLAEKADPEYLYYNKMQDAMYTKKDIDARTPADLKPAQIAQALAVIKLDSFVKQDLLDYYVRKTELPFGTLAVLRDLWEQRGKPGSSFEDFVDNLF